MQINTLKSKEIRKYFIEVEKIFKFYNKYILMYKKRYENILFHSASGNNYYETTLF